MNTLRKFIALALATAIIGVAAGKAEAAQYATTGGGCGYQECRRAPCLAPAIALGTIALIAIIAVAVQNRGHSGHSSHSSCSSSTTSICH